MTAKISKWGNSQGLRVPKDIMESLQLHIGDNVNITIVDGKAIIEPVRQDIPDYDLNELVSKVPEDYKANEEFDTTIGKEEW
ncbi:AbrB/MazE/SpoVT family DNA-binding domain-containing protein [Halarcobacter bivalviorum]|uniref:Toxin-antitoxin system, antitoxin component, MazE family n=1 Tax=Halarcobacter bivalviorum TaxID=663364 RepID=A0AAX2AB60_9BACT|nr:AbrB/MazE/SpoVT family DNA-binding domain-containing protein [Halarcobacter bivalviorum]AXH11958.1 toxin-antitoxin system, antitoxin component, MazE family [Halarcobacter bivalviorum]RXK11075.1 transcriptional regulator/antitoxin MazE [Halarcobacter bivalviorum]